MLAVAVAGFAGSMTSVAWAPKNLSTHVIEADCTVANVGTGSFLGSISLTGFTMVGDQIAGVGTVSGTCTTASTKVITPRTSVVVPLTIQELSCHELELLLGDVTYPGTGLTLETGGLTLFLSPGSSSAQARYCAAERLAGIRSLADMLTPLSQLLFQ